MLEIKDLHAKIADKEILAGVNLQVLPGEVHAIMGPNGSGKSTLASILAGRDNYQITAGSVNFAGKELLKLSPEERASCGLFLAFQYPVEIPGINNMFFLKTALNSLRQQRKQSNLDTLDLMARVREQCQIVGLDEEFLQRPVNLGFSGGEKKRNEILQMLVLEPTLAILDEPDSGLDIDALRVVAHGINTFRSPARSVILITHYQRLLEYIVPDRVHVFAQGKIVASGGKELVERLEQEGYGWLEQ